MVPSERCQQRPTVCGCSVVSPGLIVHSAQGRRIVRASVRAVVVKGDHAGRRSELAC